MLEAFIDLQMAWQDQRLMWDSSQFDDIDILYVSCESLWAPEEFMVSA